MRFGRVGANALGAPDYVNWLWERPDLDTRIEYARKNAPDDPFTLFALFAVYRLTKFLYYILRPVDFAAQLLGKAFTVFQAWSLMLLLLLTILWFPFWGILAGTSWLWLKYAWARPILLLPGAALTVPMMAFLMLVPDPQKEPRYVTLIHEWPLTWILWNPPQSYFKEYEIWDPDINPYEEERIFRKRERERLEERDRAEPRKYDPGRDTRSD